MKQERGHQAEQVVASWLAQQGYELVAINWLHPRVEIDIVAQKADKLYVVEVKHRTSAREGFGDEYVDHKKQRQLEKACGYLVQSLQWSGEIGVVVVSTSGNTPVVDGIYEYYFD